MKILKNNRERTRIDANKNKCLSRSGPKFSHSLLTHFNKFSRKNVLGRIL